MHRLSPNVCFPSIADVTRSFQNDLMATAERDNAIGKQFGWASIANSLLLPLSAALHLNVTFWILVVTNFLLMHAIWISQVVRVRRWDRADFGPVFRWSLAAFAVLGNLSLAIWESQLTAIFPK